MNKLTNPAEAGKTSEGSLSSHLRGIFILAIILTASHLSAVPAFACDPNNQDCYLNPGYVASITTQGDKSIRLDIKSVDGRIPIGPDFENQLPFGYKAVNPLFVQHNEPPAQIWSSATLVGSDGRVGTIVCFTGGGNGECHGTAR